MSQKNKIFSITLLLLLILGSVACRKSGGGDPTPIDPTKSMTGDLLIVSVDGKTNINSIPLRFAGANATVTKVEVEQGKNLNLDPTNFIVENNALKLTNIDLSSSTEAAVSNKITLTFDLSASSSSPITRYTDTADIFVGKMQTNISVETFKKSKFDLNDGTTTKADQDAINGAYISSKPHEAIDFKAADFKVGTDDTTKFFLTNSQDGKSGNKLSVAEFTTILSNSIKKNTDIQSYNSLDFEITSLTNKDAPRIATWTIKFKPSVFYNEHSILLNMSKNDKEADVGGWVD